MKERTIQDIDRHLQHAREKHPFFCGTLSQAVAIAAEEFGEWVKELNDCSFTRSREECLDLIAVLVRHLEGD